MTSDNGLSAMRRKAGVGRPPPEIGAPSPAKILKTALMQAAQDVAALPLIAGQPAEERVTLDPIVSDIPENALLMLTEGPEARYGLVLVDPQAVAALIEIQTTGRVVARPAENRAPTRTDAVMCADFIDRVMEIVETRVAEADLDDALVYTGYRYALALSEARAIPMTLDDIPYRRFTVSLDMGGGAKQGQIVFILPYSAAPARPGAEESDAFTRDLGDLVLSSEAQLKGTLHRFELPLAQAVELAVGSLIPIPGDALNKVAIEDIEGRVLLHGRLGMAKGNRAIRVSDVSAEGDDDEDMPAARSAPAALPPMAPAPDPLAGLGAPTPAPAGDLADLGDMGDLPDLGAMGAGGGLPDLDGLGDLGDMGGMQGGDLPDLGSLGGDDLPPLDDFPDLPDLGALGTG